MKCSEISSPMQVRAADECSRCFCGAEIEIAGAERHVYAAHIVERDCA